MPPCDRSSIRLLYPTQGAALSANGRFFAVGLTRVPGPLLGLMFNNRTGQIYIGKFLPSTVAVDRWKMYFQVPPNREDYFTLRIYDHPPCAVENPALTVEGLQFSLANVHGVQITNPANNGDPCCSVFSAQGNFPNGGDSDIATATMNAIPYAAKDVQGLDWYCEWETLDDGSYTLTVTGNGAPNPGQDQKTNLDVQMAYC